MFLGYLLIIAATTFWGISAVLAKRLFVDPVFTPILIAQTRATFGWLIIFIALLLASPATLKIRMRHAWHFALLGVIGIAGSNYLLYFAIERMDTALADLIQFLAPVLVAIWMAVRGFERMDRAKVIALVLSVAGCALALGVFTATPRPIVPSRAMAAGLSTFCYAFLLVWGKHLSRRYSVWTYLNYGLLAAAVFWCFVVPWRVQLIALSRPSVVFLLLGFALISVVLPYTCFFLGLKRVPASRGAIVSTWEPVAITMAAWAFLGEALTIPQVIGIVLVLAAIIVVEASTRT